jgi:hypothetical protein
MNDLLNPPFTDNLTKWLEMFVRTYDDVYEVANEFEGTGRYLIAFAEGDIMEDATRQDHTDISHYQFTMNRNNWVFVFDLEEDRERDVVRKLEVV